MWPRVIVHADMDAFYAAVEKLDDPTLAGKPVIVGGTSRRSVVSTASYEARLFGVGSSMPMAEAHRRCPHAVCLPVRMERYNEVSEMIMRVFGSFSPLVEPLSLDEAFIDMSSAQRLFGKPHQMGQGIKDAVKEATGGLTVSVGVSTTKYVAKVASDVHKPDGLTVVPAHEVLRFLHPLSVSRLWGVGKHTQSVLENMGLRTIGDVAAAPADLLRRRLGSMGDHIMMLARGDDPREVVPDREAKSIGAEYTLERDVQGRDAIMPHVRAAAQRVSRRLRKQGLQAGGVRAKLKTASFRLITRQRSLSPPADSFRAVVDVAEDLLGQFDLEQPYRLVGLAAFDLSSSVDGSQVQLFAGPGEEKDRSLDRSLDIIEQRFGRKAVKRGGDPQE